MSTFEDPKSLGGTLRPYAQLDPAPWRNGGGITREVARGTLGACGDLETVAGDDWDWRLSIANVDGDGDFSTFPGLTRILTIIRGQGLEITIDGATQFLEANHPLRFEGGASTSATLPHGPIKDLNLMFRSNTLRAEVELKELAPDGRQELGQGQLALLLQGTAGILRDGTERAELDELDTIFGSTSAIGIGGTGLVAIFRIQSLEG